MVKTAPSNDTALLGLAGAGLIAATAILYLRKQSKSTTKDAKQSLISDDIEFEQV